MKRAVKAHFRDFMALAVLFVIGLGVSGYILSNQRLHLPKWVPGVGSDFYEVNAEFWTAQAVTPGQGQTVNVAGVAVGEISRVDLRNGVAVVQLKIRRKYAPIYRDAHMLLRPKTGLKDMIVEMDPGTESAGALPEGGTIPIENTGPDVNLDEILGSLDADTRSYLQILVNGGAQGLADDAPADLRETLKRLEPTNRDLATATKLLAKRRQNLKRVVHNFSLLTNELGTKDRQLAEFVGSANANFRALAASDQNIRESLRLLPGTLTTARDTLESADAFARQLGPTSQALRPTARNLGPALAATRPFLRTTTPVIEEQLRPFARDVRPTVRQLRRAANNLEPLTPRLTRTFEFVNDLLNTLAFNPEGPEEGYLFWASWVNHSGASIFGTQDAHGPIRRGVIITSCSSVSLLESITAVNDQLDTLFQLLGAPTSKQICPSPVSPGVPPGEPSPDPAPKKGTGDGARGTGDSLPTSPTEPKPVVPKPETDAEPESTDEAPKPVTGAAE